MKIDSIDLERCAVTLRCDAAGGWGMLGRLAGFLAAAGEIPLSLVRCAVFAEIAPVIRAAVELLASRNAIAELDSAAEECDALPVPGHLVVKSEGFFCVRDFANERHYSILLVCSENEVDVGARCASIITAALGFSGSVAFEVRLGVYELLMNIVEHGFAPDSGEWMQVDLERKDDRLIISIIDRGTAFDPTRHGYFDLAYHLGARKRRGLGLVMTHRIADDVTYRREWGYNRIVLNKFISRRGALPRAGKGDSMTPFEISDPKPLADGSHLLIMSGDLDTKGTAIMERMLERLAAQKINHLTLDFEKVTFISSSGVGILLGLVSSVRDAGGDAVFVNTSANVRSVFRLLNLDDYFTIRDSKVSVV